MVIDHNASHYLREREREREREKEKEREKNRHGRWREEGKVEIVCLNKKNEIPCNA